MAVPLKTWAQWSNLSNKRLILYAFKPESSAPGLDGHPIFSQNSPPDASATIGYQLFGSELLQGSTKSFLA